MSSSQEFGGDVLCHVAAGPSVHQAAGMLVVQLDVGIEEANERLRSYAAAVGRPLNDVAWDIVNRRLRLTS